MFMRADWCDGEKVANRTDVFLMYGGKHEASSKSNRDERRESCDSSLMFLKPLSPFACKMPKIS